MPEEYDTTYSFTPRTRKYSGSSRPYQTKDTENNPSKPISQLRLKKITTAELEKLRQQADLDDMLKRFLDDV